MRTTTESLVSFTEEQYHSVLDHIPHGREFALPTQVIRDWSGIDDDRSNRRTRAIFVAANERGVPVVACGAGVFVAEKVAEVDAFIDNLEKRQVALAQRVHALRQIRLQG